MLATRGGSRTPRLYHNSDRSVGWADQCSLLNPRFEPRLRREDGADHSTLTLRMVRAVPELQHEEGAGHSTLTLRMVRAVPELRHVTFPPGLSRGVGTPIEKANARFW